MKLYKIWSLFCCLLLTSALVVGVEATMKQMNLAIHRGSV